MWELYCQQFPAPEGVEHGFPSAKEDAIKEGKRPSVPSTMPSKYANIMKACWSDNPKDRPSFPEVVHHLERLAGELAPQLKIVTAQSVDISFLKKIKTEPPVKIQTLLSIKPTSQWWCGNRDGKPTHCIYDKSSFFKLGTILVLSSEVPVSSLDSCKPKNYRRLESLYVSSKPFQGLFTPWYLMANLFG